MSIVLIQMSLYCDFWDTYFAPILIVDSLGANNVLGLTYLAMMQLENRTATKTKILENLGDLESFSSETELDKRILKMNSFAGLFDTHQWRIWDLPHRGLFCQVFSKAP